ncbi:MerR family transcriptional regulator [Serratia sp. (in: enterobacteria)]|uniref:MerR family transcriptional regulator n=1 Tax=Serratia sp. (in: enterobacteria) TaxID=616 RepID=UPI003F3E7FF5
MKIGELAERAGVAASAIRYYEQQGLLPKAVRGVNGYRVYSESALERLHLIQIGQNLGFSLQAIQRVPFFSLRRGGIVWPLIKDLAVASQIRRLLCRWNIAACTPGIDAIVHRTGFFTAIRLQWRAAGKCQAQRDEGES